MGGYCGGSSEKPTDATTTDRKRRDPRSVPEDSDTSMDNHSERGTVTKDQMGAALSDYDENVDDIDIDENSQAAIESDEEVSDSQMDERDSGGGGDSDSDPSSRSKYKPRKNTALGKLDSEARIEDDERDPRDVIGHRVLSEEDINSLPKVEVSMTLQGFTEDLVNNEKLNDRSYLTALWEEVDLNNEGILETDDVKELIERVVNDYVILRGGNEKTFIEQKESFETLRNLVYNTWLDAVEEYNDHRAMEKITKTHFLRVFTQYIEFPTPMLHAAAKAEAAGKDAAEQGALVEHGQKGLGVMGLDKVVGAVDVLNVSGAGTQSTAMDEKVAAREEEIYGAMVQLTASQYDYGGSSTVDIYPYICTSPTVTGLKLFDKDMQNLVCNNIQTILEGIAASRAQRVGRELIRMNSHQRGVINSMYRSNDGLNLSEHLAKAISGKEGNLMQNLIMLPAEFEARQLYNAINLKNYTVISDILLSRTNRQLHEIKAEYKRVFGEEILVTVNHSLKGTSGNEVGDCYELLLTNILNEMRPEELRQNINVSLVRSDVHKLKATFSGTSKIHPSQLIALFTQMSWPHLEMVHHEFCRFRDHDLITEIGNRVKGRVSDALCVMVAVATDRLSYFSKLLYDSMKGLGVSDESLVRQVVCRCEIDMGDIVNTFNARFGEGKTLYQWINDDTKGVYASMLSGLCGFTTKASESPSDALGHIAVKSFIGESPPYRYPKGYSSWTDYWNDWAPSVVGRREGDYSSSATATPVPAAGSAGGRPALQPTESEMASAIQFDPAGEAAELFLLSGSGGKKVNKKQKAEFKGAIVESLCALNNRQRQRLQSEFEKVAGNAAKQTLREACENILGKKSKSMMIIGPLLMLPEEFDCYVLKNNIKKLDIWCEILSTRTNEEILKIKDHWNHSEKSDFLGELQKTVGKKKGTGSLLMGMAQAVREETCQFDKDEIVADVTQILSEVKKKRGDHVLKVLTKKSFAHIAGVAKVWNAVHKTEIKSAVKSVLGNNTAAAAEFMFTFATDRFGLWAGKMKESMEGLGVDLDLLTRVVISRCERDLDGAARVFSMRQEFSNDKTLSQWIDDDTSAMNTYNTAIRMLLDIYDGDLDLGTGKPGDETDDGYMSDRLIRARSRTFSLQARDSRIIEKVDVPMEVKEEEEEGDAFAERDAGRRHGSDDDSDSSDEFSVTVTSKSPMSPLMSDDGGAGSGSSSAEDSVIVKPDHASSVAAGAGVTDDSPEPTVERIDYSGHIKLSKLAHFVKNKVRGSILDKIWKSMKVGDDGGITQKEMLKMLTFTVVIYVHVLSKKDPSTKKVSKEEARDMMDPIEYWIVRNKMPDKPTIFKDELPKVLGVWLEEAASLVASK